MKFLRSVFGFRGRLSRGAFWWRSACIWVVFAVASSLLLPAVGTAAAWVVNPLALWALLAQSARRLHDRDFSGKWLAIVVLPILGAAWLVWQLAFRRGVADANRWGEDPLHSRADFLVVR